MPLHTRLLLALILLLLPAHFAFAELVADDVPANMPWGDQPKFITCSARDQRTGEVWVGTETGGLWRYDAKGWTHFGVREGLAEEDVYAVAIDFQGRVWAGHLNHGVSVFNGEVWKNYGVNTGPLGARVLTIKVCPSNPSGGDVWIGTEAGLWRWSPASDEWTFITRAEGLPSDQIGSLAFDAEGRVFAGTQCEGIAIASAADGYKKWTHISGPDHPTTTGIGAGLPSHFINDILITRDQTVYVATPWGLGKSTDLGKSFSYVRGDDWADKAQRRAAGPPPAAPAAAGDAPLLLREDYITSLAEDSAQLIWVGYRARGYEVLDPDGSLMFSGGDGAEKRNNGQYVSTLLPLPGAATLIGTYGDGLEQCGKRFRIAGAPAPAAPAGAAGALPGFPHIAEGPDAKTLDAMVAKVGALKHVPLTAAFLGDDWETQGDGVGRYGRQTCTYPWYGSSGWAQGYKCEVGIGPHIEKNADGPFTYFHDLNAKEVRALFLPNSAKRTQGEWNDGTFDRAKYQHWETWEGPDLWLDVTVPAGTHRVSLYFVNFDGHGLLQRRRDLGVEVKAHFPTLEEADASPTLARTRVVNFYNGVYKQFLLQGPAQYQIKVDRNYSNVCKLSAVFFDRLIGTFGQNEPDGPPLLQGNEIDRPALPNMIDAKEHVAVRPARDLWTRLDGALGTQDAAELQRPYRLMALRLAVTFDANAAEQGNWRFGIPRMSEDDHAEFAQTMKKVASKREEQKAGKP